MTIAELIEKLKEFPDDMEILGADAYGSAGLTRYIRIYSEEMNYCKYSSYWERDG
jgi:hypothetical protein